MSVRNAIDLDARFPVRTTIPGFAGTTLLTAFTGTLGDAAISQTLVANTAVGVARATFVSSIDEYNPAFVESILAADAAEPEASFDNVIDLLEWLDRD